MTPGFRLWAVLATIGCTTDPAIVSTPVEVCVFDAIPEGAPFAPRRALETCTDEEQKCSWIGDIGGVWDVLGQSMWDNQCPMLATDFIREELKERYLIAGAISESEIVVAECLDPDGIDCPAEYIGTASFVDGAAHRPLDRNFDLEALTGYHCTRRQIDEVISWICDGQMISVKRARMETSGPECLEAVLALQQRSGTTLELDGCTLEFATFARKLRPREEAHVRALGF